MTAPEPIEVLQPSGAAVPLILDSPHSGNDYPDDFDYQIDLPLLRRSEDAHVHELFAPWTNLGATLLHARFPRAYIDANRALEDFDPEMTSTAWPHPTNPSGKVARGAGLIWKQVKNYGLIYDRLLSVAEVEHRINTCWRPYHDRVAQLLHETHQTHGCVIHLNCHSMASVGDETTEDGPGPRPDMILGDRDATSCSPRLTETAFSVLSELGYQVAVNDPYKGVELVRRYSNPADGRHSMQIELNRALYMNEDTQEKLPGYDKLQSDLVTLGAALVELAQQFKQGR